MSSRAVTCSDHISKEPAMRRVVRRSALLFAFSLFCASVFAAPPKFDTAAIDRITGAKGTLNEAEGVFKVSFPRSEVKVSVDGTLMPPFMGLTSWAAFQDGVHVEAMVMGDI